jgi:thiol-disulfide isomerase/thioredoxin
VLERSTVQWHNKIASDFAGIDYKGTKVSLHDIYKRKFVLLDFWASWCVPCREAIPFLKKLSTKHATGLQVITITSDDSVDKWRDAVRKEKISDWINLRPNKIVPNPIEEKYGVNFLPTWILIKKGGLVVGMYGNTEASKEKLRRALDSLIIISK